jgi:integrase
VLNIHLLGFFAGKQLDQISVREIERYKAAKLQEGLAKKTINNHLGVLGKLLRVAHEWDLLGQIPKIKLLRAPKPAFRFLDFEEAERLIEAARSEPLWHTMIVVALTTGLRVGELLALEWADLDLLRGRMVVRRSAVEGVVDTPKSGRIREIPLNERARTVLRAHRHLRGELVFCQEDGSMLTDGQIKWPLYRIRRRADIMDVAWHDLRHTFASHLAMRGVALKSIQELLGHASIEMTMRYAHLSPAVLRDAVATLDQPGSTSTARELADSGETPRSP